MSREVLYDDHVLERWCELRGAGKSQKETAKALGVGVGSIGRVELRAMKWQAENARTPVFQKKVAICSYEGCDRPVHARGMCGMHYLNASRAAKKHGNLGRRPEVNKPPRAVDELTLTLSAAMDVLVETYGIGQVAAALAESAVREIKRELK